MSESELWTLPLVRNSLYAILAALFTAAALLATYKLATASTGVGALGTWSIAFSLTSLAGVADLGIPLSMSREVAKLRSAAEWKSVSRLVIMGALVSAAATLLFAGLSMPVVHWLLDRFVFKGQGSVPDGLLLACALNVSLMSLTLTFTGALEGIERYDLKFWCLLFGNCAMVATVFALAPGAHPALIAWAFVVQYGCSALAAAVVTWRSLRGLRSSHGGTPLPTGNLLAAAIRVGAPLRMAGLASFFFEPISRFYFGTFGGVASAGIYEIASRLCIQAHGLISSAAQVLVPRMTMLEAADQSGSRELLRGASRLTAIAALLGLGGILLGITSISNFLLSGISRDFAFLAAMLGTAWMFHVLASPAYFANIVDGTVHWNWLSQWSAVVVSAVMGPVCWFLSGSWQAIAIGPFLGLVVATLVALVSRRRRTGEPAVQVVFADLRSILVVSLILGACQLAAMWLFDGRLLLSAGIVTLVMYGAFALRFLSRTAGRISVSTS